MTEAFAEDVAVLKATIATLPVDWDGKASILKLQEASYNWRQMEWWAFYFEYLCREVLADTFTIPGERFGNVGFDLKRSVNWDLKSKAIKSDDHQAILNDKTAMQETIAKYGEHGVVIALCDVEYNDVERTFQAWHSELKGGKSKYETERETRTNVSRYRKTRALLTELLILRFTADDLENLGTMKQGRNSNGKPRREKYLLDLEDASGFLVDRIVFRPVEIPTGLAQTVP
ncbi:MAG: hypothetical protein H7Y38_08870 [Armatimonadetes bacterium]|nr:hypothetical protein [Armatimonadota bacterium]